MTSPHTPIGVASFDSVRRPAGSGWAALWPDPAFRFRDYRDLDSRVVWWTNLPTNRFEAAGFARIPRLRRSEFFGLSMAAIACELGLTEMSGSQRTQLMAQLAGALAGWGRELGVAAMPRHDFRSSFRRDLFGRRRGFRSAQPLVEAVNSTWSVWTDCGSEALGNVSEDRVFVDMQLRRHRATHSANLLQAPAPQLGAKWYYVPRGELNRAAALLNDERPTIVLGRLSGDGARNLLPEFSAPDTRSVWMRRYAPGLAWVIAPLAQYIAQELPDCELEVVDAVRTDSLGAPLIADVPILADANVSYAYGMMLQTRVESYLYRGQCPDRTPTSAWICGLDRLQLLRELRLVANQLGGGRVVGYGMGSARLLVNRTSVPDLYSVLHRTHLLPNLRMGSKFPAQSEPLGGGCKGVEMQRALIARGQPRSVIALDQHLLDSRREQRIGQLSVS